ncbi:hypothetical protein VUR80DRAFT_8557 [Thermomyces stellatus]
MKNSKVRGGKRAHRGYELCEVINETDMLSIPDDLELSDVVLLRAAQHDSNPATDVRVMGLRIRAASPACPPSHAVPSHKGPYSITKDRVALWKLVGKGSTTSAAYPTTADPSGAAKFAQDKTAQALE